VAARAARRGSFARHVHSCYFGYGEGARDMGFRFRRSIKIIPGIRLNVGKRGISTSLGIRGAHVTVGKTGVRNTVGIPGTGMSWTSLRRPSPPSAMPNDARADVGSPSRSATGWGTILLLVVILAAVYLLASR
jgi:hypothetical protein